jgi:hypothetical protein
MSTSAQSGAGKTSKPRRSRTTKEEAAEASIAEVHDYLRSAYIEAG